MTTTMEKEVAISIAGSWFERDGDKVDLSNRPSLRRILARLVETHRQSAGRSVSVHELIESGWVDVDTILDETTVKNIIPKLKKAGAQGIVEYPLNKVNY